MMFRVGYLFLVSLAAVVAGKSFDEEFEEKCRIVIEKRNHCCKIDIQRNTDAVYKNKWTQAWSECKASGEAPGSCANKLCVLIKMGHFTPDGEINKDKLTETVYEEIKGAPMAVINAVKEKCVDGDLSIYGPKDDCKPNMFMHCVEIQLIGNCPSWDNAGPCAGAQEAAAECYKMFS